MNTVAARVDRRPSGTAIAVFDLDGTLTARDTLLPFLRFVVGTPAFLLRLPLLVPLLGAMALGLVSRDRAKQWVLTLFLRRLTRMELGLRGEAFARERLPALLRAQAKARLDGHRSAGHRCVLATASLACYVVPWARDAGFDDVCASELEYDAAQRATGRIAGANCRGKEKLRRLQALLGDLAEHELHGYGDSRADRAFLAHCSEAHYRPFRTSARRNSPRDFLKLMRPHQWLKNGFVFVGLLFGHAWLVPQLLASALLAAGAFCLVSSAVYIVNDFADRERDRVHPKKRHRPLASQAVGAGAALVVAAVLAGAGLALGAAAGPIVAALLAGYAAMNMAYTYALKNVVILDVFVIAAGFLLRILAGTLGIGIAPSQWLLVCSLFLTLFLGFTKRRSELLSVGEDFRIHRKALLHYNAQLLDKMIGVSAAAALMSYSLYTMSPATVQVHGTEHLVYTIPLVAYGMFRYLYLLHAQHAGADASRELTRDPHLAATLLAWAGLTAVLIA